MYSMLMITLFFLLYIVAKGTIIKPSHFLPVIAFCVTNLRS